MRMKEKKGKFIHQIFDLYLEHEYICRLIFEDLKRRLISLKERFKRNSAGWYKHKRDSVSHTHVFFFQNYVAIVWAN